MNRPNRPFWKTACVFFQLAMSTVALGIGTAHGAIAVDGNEITVSGADAAQFFIRKGTTCDVYVRMNRMQFRSAADKTRFCRGTYGDAFNADRLHLISVQGQTTITVKSNKTTDAPIWLSINGEKTLGLQSLLAIVSPLGGVELSFVPLVQSIPAWGRALTLEFSASDLKLEEGINYEVDLNQIKAALVTKGYSIPDGL